MVTIPISCMAASSRIKGDEALLAPATRSSHKVLSQGDSIFTIFCRAGLKTKRYHQAGGCREGEVASLASRAPVRERCTAFNKQGPFLILFAPELVCSLAAGDARARCLFWLSRSRLSISVRLIALAAAAGGRRRFPLSPPFAGV